MHMPSQSIVEIYGYGILIQLCINGGPYWGFYDFDSHLGVLSHLYIWDPNLLKNFDVYDKTVKFMRELDLDDDSLKKALLQEMGPPCP